jgi:dihydroorotase
VFLGTDSAPHPTHRKEAECCAAGCFTAPVAMGCLAELFEECGALDRLEGFVSLHGPTFYGLPTNEATLTLRKGDPLDLPGMVDTGAGTVTVWSPGREIHWRVV